MPALTQRTPASRVAGARPFTARNGRLHVVARAQGKGNADSAKELAPKLGSALLAATIALSLSPVLEPLVVAPAHADEIEETPFEKRQRERREMLRAAREKAEQRSSDMPGAMAAKVAESDAAIEASNAERRAAAERMAAEMRSTAADAYSSAAAGAPSLAPPPPPVAVPEPAPVKPSFQLKPLDLPKYEAPKYEAPRAVELPPVPEPVATPAKARPIPATTSAPKKAEQPSKKKKRGVMPLFLAEFLVIGSFAGVAAATTVCAEKTDKALAAASSAAKAAYGKLQEALDKAD